MKNVIFLDVSKNFDRGELLQNYFSLHKKLPNRSKFKPTNLEKINVARDNKTKFTCGIKFLRKIIL